MTTTLTLVPTTVVLAVLTEDEPAKATVEGLREPDILDLGRAYWISDEAVVCVSLDRLGEVPQVLNEAPRVMPMHDRAGWVRLHPSHYGIEVDSHFDHGRGLEAHDAQSAWDLARKAVLA